MPNGTDLLCGVDIGSTHIKAVLVAENGSVVSVAKAPTPVTRDGYGACHDPERVRATAEQVMCQAQEMAPVAGQITAVGVTSVGEEGVPLDARDELLYPSIAWYERRPSAPERDWSARHSDEELFTVTGLHKDLGFTIFKWLWLRSAQPAAWSACAWWLGIADYVIWRWTGQRGMSVGHASRTAAFDLTAFRWRDDWVGEALARGVDALPPLHEAGSTVGMLRRGHIPGLVTAAEVPVVATGLDHVVGAYATGVLRPGQVLDSMGTAEALIEPVPAHYLRDADHAVGIDFSAGILPRTHIALAGLEAGAGVDGMLQILGAVSPPRRRELEYRAAQLPPGADGLRYIPPRMRSKKAGGMFGHKVSHRAEHLYRCTVEGWALAAADALCGMGEQDGVRKVICIGGGSESLLWTQIKASILGQELHCVQTPEIVAVGAALLAGQATSGFAPTADWEPVTRAVIPVPDWAPQYRTLRKEFDTLARLIHSGGGTHVYP